MTDSPKYQDFDTFLPTTDPPRPPLYKPGDTARIKRIEKSPDQIWGKSGMRVRIKPTDIYTLVRLLNGEWDIYYSVTVFEPSHEVSDAIPESWLEPLDS